MLALAPAANAAHVGNTYLALGDSLAYGYHAAQFKSELESKGFVEPATFNDGYVDDFGATLKLANPKLQIINDGCPGETTETFINGSGLPGLLCGRSDRIPVPLRVPTPLLQPTHDAACRRAGDPQRKP